MDRAERQARLRTMLKQIAPDQNLEELSPVGGIGVERAEATFGPAVRDEALDRASQDLEKLEQGVPLSDDQLFGLEAIVLAEKRPALFIQEGKFRRPPDPFTHFAEGEIQRRITEAIPSIGRIELPDHRSIPYGGTGFVVGENLLMTNRHVAALFATGLGKRVRFQEGQSAAIDFLREYGFGESDLIEVKKIVMIHPFWDMALLKVSGLSNRHKPLMLSVRHPDDAANQEVAVIGYPAKDLRNDLELQDRIFEKTYNVKRLQPGLLRQREKLRSFASDVNALTHDGSTLGGNSGSAVIDVSTGQVIALHFAGEYLKANYAVPAYELARDSRVVDAGVNFAGSVEPTREWHFAWKRAHAEETAAPSNGAAKPAHQQQVSSPAVVGPVETTITLPLEITIRIGQAAGPTSVAAVASGEAEEAVQPDPNYANRKGYDATFLGNGTEVPLPRLKKKQAKLAAVNRASADGDFLLPYHHFSLVMNRQRRLAFFTAVNIDGRKEKSLGRDSSEKWFRDPRIDPDEQLGDDLYAANRFDRGHLVRRLDPVWGTAAQARKANDDTFHWTNCSPQHEQFNRNQTTWGLVENWILKNAHARNDRVSVFTGPVFRTSDPVFVTRRGERVSIPLEYWKVVAMLDQRGRLTATAYLLSQETLIADMVEAVREPKSFQTSVRNIERLTKLDFHDLPEHDPFVERQEALAESSMELQSLDDIVVSRPDLADGAAPAAAAGEGAVLAVSPLNIEEGVVGMEAPAEPPVRKIVWFGTNRALVDKNNPALGFSNQRSDTLSYGRCRILVPRSHTFGSTGSPWFWRLLRWTDDRLKLKAIECLARQNFWTDMRQALDLVAEGGRQALLFLHGYNNSFVDAAVRAAQIGVDLKFPGLVCFFSWPSKGSVDGYLADAATIDASESAVLTFVNELLSESGADVVHVLAHSMGNRALLRTVERISAAARPRGVRLGQIILAAPDVDADLFRNLAANYAVGKRTTLYVSPSDRAIGLSKIIHGASRVGLSPPVTVVDGIDTIDVPGFNVFELGHGYFAEAAPVMSDIFTVLTSPQLPIERRQRLAERRNDEDQRYWAVLE